jgi:excisionase family DNA binding protein
MSHKRKKPQRRKLKENSNPSRYAMKPPIEKELILYTVEEVGAILKMSKRGVEYLITRGDLPRVKVGPRLVRVREVDLEAFVEANVGRERRR